MTREEIKILAERIASGTATEEEMHLYNRIYNSFQQAEIEWNEDVYGNKSELEALMKKNILEKATIKKPVIQMMWFRWSAAAAIVLAFGTLSFFLFQKSTGDTSIAEARSQEERFKNDADPGQVGAILTLSNGEKIVLDSADNGSLTRQGNTEIIKKNGVIEYSSKGNTSAVVFNTMTTPRGRQYNLVLADGTKVWLNAASSITFPSTFSGKERKVTISGEAYLEVAHNDRMPFIVEKDDLRVQVLGTHFNVNTYDDESSANITLLEGSVKVVKGTQSGIIKPGQQAQVGNAGTVKVVNNINLQEVMAWKNGVFDFEGTQMEALMRQISRWYNVEVVYKKKIDDLFYAEIPRNTKLSEVLKALELTGKVQFEIEGEKIIVMP